MDASMAFKAKLPAARAELISEVPSQELALSEWSPPKLVSKADVALATEETKNLAAQREVLQAHENIYSALSYPIPPVGEDGMTAKDHREAIMAQGAFSLKVLSTIQGEKQTIVWDTRDPRQRADLKKTSWYVEQIVRFQGMLAPKDAAAAATKMGEDSLALLCPPTNGTGTPESGPTSAS
jgi:hypothetical protein